MQHVHVTFQAIHTKLLFTACLQLKTMETSTQAIYTLLSNQASAISYVEYVEHIVLHSVKNCKKSTWCYCEVAGHAAK
jgi:tRNA threonylcarbamoyladenosine modification (KEOPS) complex Cgi121 subunit